MFQKYGSLISDVQVGRSPGGNLTWEVDECRCPCERHVPNAISVQYFELYLQCPLRYYMPTKASDCLARESVEGFD